MHCVTTKINVGTFLVERNAFDESPPYQRQGEVWSLEKRQLFIDSLLNGFDVPKIYLHYVADKDPRYKYAIVDGKQRLNAIWDFCNGTFPLADDFKISETDGHTPILAGSRFLSKDGSPQLDKKWQERFRAKNLDVVEVRDAEEDDIEDMFSRLNNGEPLNAAEKRNAIGGRVCQLIRDVAENTFFMNLPFGNNRYQHLELVVKLLLLEKTESDGGDVVADLKKRYLDKLVKDNREMPESVATGLTKRVAEQLKAMGTVFTKSDPLLAKQAYLPLYYLFVKTMTHQYADAQLKTKLHDFLEKFQAHRASNNEKQEDERDSALLDFDRLMQQGTNDKESIKKRLSILRRYFLLENPSVELRDKNREFTDEERFAIWTRGGKQCAKCLKKLELDEMHADHKKQWAHGGETSLRNAQSLCPVCNTSLNQHVK